MGTTDFSIWLPGPPLTPSEFCKPEDCHNAHPGNAHNGAGWMLPFNDGKCPCCGWTEEIAEGTNT